MQDRFEKRDAIEHAALFNALWALFVLIHIYKLTPWGPSVVTELRIVNWFLVANSLFVIFRPKNVWLFFALICFQVLSVFIQLPAMANCWLFSGFIATGILVVYGRLCCLTGFSKFNVADVYREIAPALRLSLICLYGFAVLAKCNYAFFNVETSCAAFFCELIVGSYGIANPPDWLLWSAIPGTIAVEAAIPILLIFSRTRRYGILLGLLFHTFIAHSYKILVFDFSAMLLPLYLAFTTPDLIAILKRSRYAESTLWVARHRRPVLIAMALILMGGIWSITTAPNNVTVALFKFRGMPSVVVGVLAVTIFGLEFFKNQCQANSVFRLSNPFKIRNTATGLTLLLVTVNGFSPYLGLKTGVAYTMFSNLRTESGFENHLFMPSALKLFPYQNETVLLLASSEPKLNRLVEANERLLIHDLRRRLEEYPEASIRYRFRGEDKYSATVESDPVIGKPLNDWERKLLFFRSIPLYNHRHQW